MRFKSKSDLAYEFQNSTISHMHTVHHEIHAYRHDNKLNCESEHRVCVSQSFWQSDRHCLRAFTACGQESATSTPGCCWAQVVALLQPLLPQVSHKIITLATKELSSLRNDTNDGALDHETKKTLKNVLP